MPEILHAVPGGTAAAENFEARRHRASELLRDGRFREALELATALRSERPDDLEIMGLVADAQIETGELKQAEATVQWMLDMRPQSAEALLHVARFRAAIGDHDGARDAFSGVIARLPLDPAAAALLLVEGAGYSRRAGQRQEAKHLLARAAALHSSAVPASRDARRAPKS